MKLNLFPTIVGLLILSACSGADPVPTPVVKLPTLFTQAIALSSLSPQ